LRYAPSGKHPRWLPRDTYHSHSRHVRPEILLMEARTSISSLVYAFLESLSDRATESHHSGMICVFCSVRWVVIYTSRTFQSP